MTPTTGFLNCTPAEYLADPFPTPSISSSMAHTLVSESPAHAYLRHPKLGGKRRDDSTKATDIGSLIHSIVLGKGARICVVEANDWRKKAAKEKRDEARESGQIPILAADMEDARIAAVEIQRKFADLGIVLDGESEVAFSWEEQGDVGETIQARGMVDHLTPDKRTIYDLKTTACAAPHAVERSIYDYGYDIQLTAYTNGIKAITGEEPEFKFLFCEVNPPYNVTVGIPTGTLKELGYRRWNKAVSLWAKCLKTNKWPGYTDGPVLLDAPLWAINMEPT